MPPSTPPSPPVTAPLTFGSVEIKTTITGDLNDEESPGVPKYSAGSSFTTSYRNNLATTFALPPDRIEIVYSSGFVSPPPGPAHTQDKPQTYTRA